MGSEKHLLVKDNIFDLVNRCCAELNLKGIKVNLCDITNLAIEKGIVDAVSQFNEEKNENAEIKNG